MSDRWETVPRLISDNLYCVLATADAAGTPWATPVFFAARGHRELFWVSASQSRHSLNIGARPAIAVTIFDSGAGVGAAEAIYLVAEATVCSDAEAALGVMNARLPSRAQLTAADLVPTGPLTAYRAAISRHFVLIRGGDPAFDNVVDARHEVHPPEEESR